MKSVKRQILDKYNIPIILGFNEGYNNANNNLGKHVIRKYRKNEF